MILINSSPKNALKIFQPFLPISVPIGIGSILGVAEQEGINAKLIDEQVEGDVLGLVDRYTKEMDAPYIFGFSVLTASFKNAIFTSKELKRLYPASFIVFGGIHPSAMPEEVLQYGHVDAVIRGEGETALVGLYRCIKEGRDFTRLDNLSFRKNGVIFHNRLSPAPEDLNKQPSFPYHRFSEKSYDLGFVVSSRGCPYGCIFCSNRIVTKRSYRFRRADVIADELELLYKKYKKAFAIFFDDNLLVNRERVYSLMEEIRKRGLDERMTFSFQARGDNVDDKLLRDLYRCGFRSVFFGLETSNEEIMKRIKKGETVAQCIEAVRLAKQIGFHVSATFIYGLPGETHRDRMNCVKIARELKIDMVRYNNATPYPGTELYEIAKNENRLKIKGLYENFNSVSTFIENPFKKIPFSYVPEGNSEKEIRQDILLSYLLSYMDFRKIRRIFASPDEGAGWFNAGDKLTIILKKTPALLMLSAMLVIKFGELFFYMITKKAVTIAFKGFKPCSGDREKIILSETPNSR